MEMEGRDDDRRGRWSNGGEQTRFSSSSYTISSSSGTIVSRTTYTSSASQPSSLSAAAKLVDLELDEETPTPCLETEEKDAAESVGPINKPHKEETQQERKAKEKEKVKVKAKEIKFLVQEFFGAPPPLPSSSSDCSTKGGDTGVLDWWLKHVGVGCVLQGAAAAGAPAATTTFDAHKKQSWIRALDEITEAVRIVASLCHDGKNHQEPDETGIIQASNPPDEFQFARFIQQAMLKTLAFVDVTAIAPKDDDKAALLLEEKYHKLCTQLRVRSALSRTLARIRYWLSFHSPPSQVVERIHGETVSLLSAKESEAAEAIWSTMEEIRIESIEGLSTSLLTPHQGSSDIHKSTRSVVSYIEFIWLNTFSMSDIVSEAASLGNYVPQADPAQPLHSMIVEMISCLQEKLANMSESFAEQSLRFLFLVNNFYFIYDTLEHHLLIDCKDLATHLTRQIGINMGSYLQVSWAPLLSCLFSSTPQCLFGRNHAPLSKFLSKFHKIYTTQKHWKVPDPAVRRTLRKAVIRKIIPSYKIYIEDNKVTTPEFSPLELEEMLQELFEG